MGREIRSTKGRKITCCDVLEMEKHQNLENEEERKTFLEKNIYHLVADQKWSGEETGTEQMSDFSIS